MKTILQARVHLATGVVVDWHRTSDILHASPCPWILSSFVNASSKQAVAGVIYTIMSQGRKYLWMHVCVFDR